ncbi:MAG: AAA family ATPase, partial [Burkholderiales bacterium]
MTTLRASSLDVAGFRGIRRSLSLQFGRKLTIIYGGNASGKSSLSQAIEFALTGQVLDYEDKPIPARYLTHTNSSDEGSVTLRLTDGSTNTALKASTTEARKEIEQRFRTIGAVDWPDKQRVPITTTHIMAQGALAKVLGTDSITRNDLSSLCTGAYLRFLLARAERLADYFRQASTGRNMISDIKDAQAAL